MNSGIDDLTIQEKSLPQGWRQISPLPGTLTTVGDILYAQDTYTNVILRYDQSHMYWEQVHDMCDLIVGSESTLYSLTESKTAGTVEQFDDFQNEWIPIGTGFLKLIAGGRELYGVKADKNIYRYQQTPNKWEQIGGPGYLFVANDIALYGITTDQMMVNQFTKNGWKVIGRNAGKWSNLIAGGGQVYGLDGEGNIKQYQQTLHKWEQIGGPGYQFVAHGSRLIGIGPDQKIVAEYQYGDQWKAIWQSPDQKTMLAVALGDTFAFGITSYRVTILYTFA